MKLELPIRQLAQVIADAGGRPLIVGGFVRDLQLGIPSKDIDFEVYNLSKKQLEQALRKLGKVVHVGRAFGVMMVSGYDVDIALPRRDNKTGRGHRGFQVELDPTLDFAEAARRRDLTINSIGLDPLSGEILDPHGGLRDLADKRLRATDARHFSEDPLRGLRVAQFAARFEMAADAELVELCRALDLSELPGERLFEEFRKLLLKGKKPSLGLAFLHDSDLLRFFPELAALVGVEQDPVWHPEGDVWTHTLLVVDAASKARTGEESHDLALMFGALCHDLGKPKTTETDGERVWTHGHETAGLQPTKSFLTRLMASKELMAKVPALVRHHMAPVNFINNKASAKAYRRLARSLADAGLTIELLLKVARADHFGRSTEEAIAGRFEQGERFAERARDLAVARQAPHDAVQGRHLIERGLEPGPRFGVLLTRCRELQDETGIDDPDQLLDRVLAEST